MKCLTRTLAILSLACVFAFAGLTPAFAAKVTLKLGGIQPADDTSSIAMQRYSQLLAERSNGEIDLQWYPAQQLGDATTQIEATSMGSQDMFFDAGSFMGTFVPDKNVESMYFLFRDQAHYLSYLNSDVMKDFEDRFMKQQGVRVVANNYVRQPRSTVSTKPLRSLADFAGLKQRVPDIRGYLESVSAIGASPVQIAWGETYLALQQGVVAACESPLDMVYTSKFFEPAKHITLTEHIRDNMVIMINDSKFQSLTPEQQNLLITVGKEVGEWYTTQNALKVDEYVAEMKKAGVEFIEMDVAPLRAAVALRAQELEKKGLWPVGLYEKIGQMK
ncbi:MAG: TRAP transporter substrate-binding protein [Candidatus Adiutrix sp.]|jgi:tripartite ATP-independent transporter DctP family solute receptor|nr:TRAP transporter substrate-binding protein [Candidatus Adiutrix sp.]